MSKGKTVETTINWHKDNKVNLFDFTPSDLPSPEIESVDIKSVQYSKNDNGYTLIKREGISPKSKIDLETASLIENKDGTTTKTIDQYIDLDVGFDLVSGTITGNISILSEDYLIQPEPVDGEVDPDKKDITEPKEELIKSEYVEDTSQITLKIEINFI